MPDFIPEYHIVYNVNFPDIDITCNIEYNYNKNQPKLIPCIPVAIQNILQPNLNIPEQFHSRERLVYKITSPPRTAMTSEWTGRITTEDWKKYTGHTGSVRGSFNFSFGGIKYKDGKMLYVIDIKCLDTMIVLE